MAKHTKLYDLLGVSIDKWSLLQPGAVLTGRQVSPTCAEAELRKAYRVGALKHHPGVYHFGQV